MFWLLAILWVFACRGIDTYAEHVCWHRRDRGEQCSPAKNHKVTFLLLALFTDEKRGKSQKEERIPLLNTFCRLAATGANTLPRPSNYSIVTATGSKRSSADSDLLLCHVGLWRTSRFRFGCASVCEHSEINVILIVSSAHSLYPRPPTLLCGRAGNACTNLLGSLV